MAFGSAVAFAAAGLILPPLGVIDGSVLMLSAQLLVLCATLLGVEGYYEKMKEILKPPPSSTVFTPPSVPPSPGDRNPLGECNKASKLKY